MILADFAAVVKLLHREKIHVEASVLMNGEADAVFLGAGDQPLEGFERKG